MYSPLFVLYYAQQTYKYRRDLCQQKLSKGNRVNLFTGYANLSRRILPRKKKFSNKCTINFYCIIAKEFVINTFHLYLYFEQNFLLRSPLEGIPLYHPRNILNNISITVLSLLIFMTWNGSFWFCSTIPTAMCTSGRSRSFAVCVAWMFQWCDCWFVPHPWNRLPRK